MPASPHSSAPPSAPPSPSLSLARLAFVSQSELEATLAREKEAAEAMHAAGEGGKLARVMSREEQEEKQGWRAAVGPRSGRKIGKLLRGEKAEVRSAVREDGFARLVRVQTRVPSLKRQPSGRRAVHEETGRASLPQSPFPRSASSKGVMMFVPFLRAWRS
ncbi:hypothetical protein JCM10207_006087 [Rhodosporidiobolus poonsookiae]